MIGFIGLGNMGKPMATHVLETFGELVVNNRSKGPVDDLVALGAKRTTTAVQVAEQCDVVILALPGPDEVRTVVLEDLAFRQALRPGSLLIDTSTIDPGLAVEVAEVISSAGSRAVDAPVSGGTAGASEGQLSVMVGGAKEAYEAARPVLDAFASTVTHVGPSGAGQAAKAANQMIVAGNLAIVAEAFSLLEMSNADVAAALDAIGSGLAGSEVLRRKREGLLAREFKPGFRIDLHVKDLRIALDMARYSQVPALVTAIAMQYLISSQAHGEGGLDHSAISNVVQRLAKSEP